MEDSPTKTGVLVSAEKPAAMQIFRRKVKVPGKRLKKMFYRRLEIATKSIFLMVRPIVVSVLFMALWKKYIYENGVYFDESLKDMLLALITVSGVLYGLLFAIALATVWDQYNKMRIAVKQYDVDTFMELRDEEVSPLMHMAIFQISLVFLSGFATYKYPSVESGLVFNGIFSFSLALLYFVVKEIDDPCHGLWFIKSIPQEWLLLDPRDYREERIRKARAEFEKKNGNGKAHAVSDAAAA